MSNSFNELLFQMLKAYNEGMSVEEIIANQIENESLSEEQARSVQESADYHDLLLSSYDDLQKAKAQGDSREDWLGDRLDERLSDLSPEQKDIALVAIQKTLMNNIGLSDENQVS